MSWESVCAVFHSVYASWKPSMFRHELFFHGYVCGKLAQIAEVFNLIIARGEKQRKMRQEGHLEVTDSARMFGSRVD